jgi:hypothetical protein
MLPAKRADDANTLPVPTPLAALPEYLGRIVITPAAALFTKLGDRTTLKAEFFDASGQKIATTLTWESSRAGIVAVDADGQVTAMAAVGSAQIRVRAGGLVSPPVLIVVAEPAAGAVLVSDTQIIAGPSATDPAAATGIGSKVTLSVTGVPALAPGTVLLASEGKPVAGRVVSATSVAGQDRLGCEQQQLDWLHRDRRRFLELRRTIAVGPRQADGSLPVSNFLHLSPSSGLIDKGVDVGLPYLGVAPDLGAYEAK